MNQISKLIIYAPFSSVGQIELRVTSCHKILSQVEVKTEAHYVLNDGMWNPDGTPYPLLKVSGAMLSGTPWRPMGYIWDKGPDIHMASGYEGAANFIVVTALISSGKPVDKPSYDSAQRGKRGRSAIGSRGGSLALCCSDDGIGNATTPETPRGELAGLDWVSTVMLDGSGSSQYDFGGERITASRKVHNWICVYLKQAGQTPSEEEDKPMNKYTVTPSIGAGIHSSPGTGYGRVRAYPMDTVVDVLEGRDDWGRTNKDWVSLAYLETVKSPQRVTDTGLAIQTHLIAPGADNRPGGSDPCGYVTIHEIGNAAKGADAAAHAAYLDSSAGECDLVSWHYSVDGHTTVQNLLDAETAYRAGDGENGPGNAANIGVEICVNAGGDFEAAKADAAALAKLLTEEHGIHIDRVVQHNYWNSKDCPKTIRATPGAWGVFLALCRGESTDVSKLSVAVDKLAATGLIDSSDYWKDGDYSAENVWALIIKWAASR